MTFTELLTEAQKLSPLDRIRLATELLQSVTSKWNVSSSMQVFTLNPTPTLTQYQPSKLLTLLASLSPIEDNWPDFDEGLLPLEDDIDL